VTSQSAIDANGHRLNNLLQAPAPHGGRMQQTKTHLAFIATLKIRQHADNHQPQLEHQKRRLHADFTPLSWVGLAAMNLDGPGRTAGSLRMYADARDDGGASQKPPRDCAPS
jgi:hypothetical protein